MAVVFVDTSFLYALEDASDENHAVALEIWKKTFKHSPRLILTSYVFDETVTLLQSKLGHAKAVDVGERLLGSALVEFIHVTPELFLAAWDHFAKHKDKGYSFTDCVSFRIMSELGIRSALAFDKHFRQAGFKVLET